MQAFNIENQTENAIANDAYVLENIRYYAPHVTSLLEDMRIETEKSIQNLLRKLSSKMPSFPIKLLYLPRNMAGLGVKCPTVIIMSTTTAMKHRAQLQLGEAANAMG